jgi:hypothetical protein
VAVGLAAACGVAFGHGFRGLPWMLQLVGVYISLQIPLQVGYSYGVLSF